VGHVAEDSLVWCAVLLLVTGALVWRRQQRTMLQSLLALLFISTIRLLIFPGFIRSLSHLSSSTPELNYSIHLADFVSSEEIAQYVVVSSVLTLSILPRLLALPWAFHVIPSTLFFFANMLAWELVAYDRSAPSSIFNGSSPAVFSQDSTFLWLALPVHVILTLVAYYGERRERSAFKKSIEEERKKSEHGLVSGKLHTRKSRGSNACALVPIFLSFPFFILVVE
jgi:hypothetical protein